MTKTHCTEAIPTLFRTDDGIASLMRTAIVLSHSDN